MYNHRGIPGNGVYNFTTGVSTVLRVEIVEKNRKLFLPSLSIVPICDCRNCRKEIANFRQSQTCDSFDFKKDKAKFYNPNTFLKTKQGLIEGLKLLSRDKREYYGFLGIPYAKPPVGNLRFKSPEPSENWNGVRDGTIYPNICLQFPQSLGVDALKDPDRQSKIDSPTLIYSPDQLIGNEDCLYLNVFTPNVPTNGSMEKLPVMVYIHGGLFSSFGTGQEVQADYFMDEDVILVTADYRIGVLGFLNLNQSTASGNQGMKDQIMVLKWIQSNIEDYGGNPDLVTIFGSSFGGTSVTLHLNSAMSTGLIHRGIGQSGTFLYPGNFPIDPTKSASRLSKLLGCDKNFDCLLAQSPNKLVLGSMQLIPEFTFGPSVDSASRINDKFLEYFPTQSIENIRSLKFPYLTGIVEGEGLEESLPLMNDMIFLSRLTGNWSSGIISYLFLDQKPNYPIKLQTLSNLIKAYYFPKNIQDYQVEPMEFLTNLTNLYTDRFFFHPFTVVNEYLSKAKSKLIKNSKIYQYLFTKSVDFSYVDDETSKFTQIYNLSSSKSSFPPCHSDELQFLFPLSLVGKKYPYINPQHKDYRFSKLIVNLWTHFARYGDPNSSYMKTQKWSPYNPQKGPFKFFELNDNPKMIYKDHLKNRKNFWDQFNLEELYV